MRDFMVPDAAGMSERLRKDVVVLASEIGERHVWLPEALERAASYVETRMAGLGYSHSAQTYEVEGQTVRNIVLEIKGNKWPDEVIVVGAHYDSRCGMKHRRSTVRVPGLKGTPGANDNASGIAALLELARIYEGDEKPDRTLRLVAFVNEEHPFFQTPRMGSWVYARACRAKRENVVGMIAFDDLGFYTDAPQTQVYPFPLNLAYPSVGNFVAFVSNRHSRNFLQRSLSLFRKGAALPTIGCSVPAVIPRIGWSDDWAFWQEGYPAFCITDTAFLRYREYHTTDDTPDKLDYGKMAEVVSGVRRVLDGLLSGASSRIS